jgi:hypothetical protein
MPRLDQLPDLLAGFDPSSGYFPIPPPNPDAADGAAFIKGEKWARELFAGTDFKSFASVAQGTMAAQAGRVGVPTWIVAPFREVFLEMPLVEGKSLVSASLDAVYPAVTGLAADVGVALTDAAVAIPIIGALVKIGVSLAKVIRQQVKDGKPGTGHRDIYSEMSPMTYELADDYGQGNNLLGFGRSGDWTDAFMPTNSEPIFRIAPLSGTQGGHRWWADPGQGLGLMPGIADQLGVYQSVHRSPQTTGDFLPSGRKFATMLWQSVMKPSVQQFYINSHAVQEAWASWFDALWKFSYVGPASLNLSDHDTQWLRARVQQSASYSRLYECEGGNALRGGTTSDIAPEEATGIKSCLVDWKDPSKGYRPPVFKPESVIKAFPRDKLGKKIGELSGLYSDIVRYVCTIHRERASSTLETLVVAYVPSDAPLLAADAMLRQKHRDMRTLLLTHPDRFRVELDLVPTGTPNDREWLAALDRSRPPGFEAVADVGLKSGKSTGRIGIVPAIVGVYTPPPDAPDVGVPEGAETPSGGLDGGAGWFMAGLAGVALTAAGVAVARRRRRR